MLRGVNLVRILVNFNDSINIGTESSDLWTEGGKLMFYSHI